MSASKIFHFPFLIIFKQIVQLWTCQYKHILIPLLVFVTDNIINSEHKMSTAKKFVLHGSSSASFKMSATKNGDKCLSVPPSSLCRPRYLTDSAHIIVTAIVNFLGSCSKFEFYECTLTSVRTAFITNLQSTIFKDRIDMLLTIILSGSMNSWLWHLYFHFLESFGIAKFMYTHRLIFEFGFVTALQLTIFLMYSVHSYHNYRPKLVHEFYWLQCHFEN